MAIPKVDLNPVQRGDTKDFALSFTDGTNPIDMRGKTLLMTVKVVGIQQDPEAALTKSVTPGAGDTNAQGGLVTLTLESSETALLVPGITYTYSVKIIEPASPEDRETTYFYGDLPVEDS